MLLDFAHIFETASHLGFYTDGSLARSGTPDCPLESYDDLPVVPKVWLSALKAELLAVFQMSGVCPPHSSVSIYTEN